MTARLVMALVGATALTALTGRAGAQGLEASPACVGAAKKMEPAAARGFLSLCAAMERDTIAKRKKLEARASVVPPTLMKACREDRDDDAALVCLDILLHKAEGAELKALRYVALVKDGRTERRYWTLPECLEDKGPGAICETR